MYVLIFSSVVSLTFFWYISKVIYSIFFGPLKEIPSPLIFQLIPIYFDVTQAIGNCPFLVHEYYLKYGKIFRVGWNRVLIVDPSAITTLFESYRFEKSPTYEGFSYFGVSLLSNRDKSSHSKKRRMLSPAFTKSKLEQIEKSLFENGVIPLIKNFDQAAKSNNIFDIYHQFHYMAWDIIGDLAFGQSFNMLKEGNHPAVGWLESVTNFYMICYAFPFLSRLKIPAGEKMRKFSYEIMNKYYNEHEDNRKDALKSGNEPVISNLLGHFMDAVDKETGATLSRDEIFAEAHLMLFAGTDTVSSQLAFLFYMLMKNPEVYNKLMIELNSVRKEEFINYECCQNNLSYLDAVIKETLRLWPAVPGSPMRLVPKGGATFFDHFLPEGVEVSTAIYSAHRSPQVWDDPDNFIPERWFGKENYNFLKRSACFIPFSLGPRSCIGKDLALMEMILMAANVLTRFSLELDSSDSHIDMVALPILRPKHSRLNVRVKPIN